MLVHGHTERTYGELSTFAKFRLRWTFAEALPPAECKVEWPDSQPTEVNNPDPEHFSLTSWCSAMPGEPLCSSQIVYTVTTRNTSRYACDTCKTSEPELTEFRGSRCGYDLIKWESLTISPGSFNACSCNLSLSCSELPSEELPRACIHFAEPAVLSHTENDDADHEEYEDHEDESEDSDSFIVFYETGEVSHRIFSSDDLDQADALGAVSADWRWLCDGESLVVVTAMGIDRWLGGAAGSQFFCHGDTLRARMALPEWWKVKFQQGVALPGSFNTDTLFACKLSLQFENLCYSTRFGLSVQVAPAQGDCDFQDAAEANSSIAYEYKSSAFGVQTYRSNKTCYPTAAFEELLVQVVDVVGHIGAEVGSSPCRTTIQYRLDAWSYRSECHSRFRQL